MGRKKSRRTATSPLPNERASSGRRPRRLILAVLALLTAGGSWAAWRALTPRSIRHDPGLSVLLISIDTLRADAIGAYGNHRVATPWIDRLALDGVLFERAHAHNVVTFPSHANMLSGRLPLEHGVRDNSGFRFPKGTPTLATELKRAGWHTGAFVSAFPLDSRFGLDEGFEVYDDNLGGAEAGGPRAFLMPERKGSLTVAAALQWVQSQQGQKWFCFLHLYEPHFPYEPAAPFDARFKGDPYYGEVSAADAALEPLLRPLLAQGAAARTLVVLTSDHGEGLGEHGEQTHGLFAYEPTLRVPLVLYAPSILPAGRRVAASVRHVDLLPTIMQALDQKPPPGLPGRSLLALLTGKGDEAPAHYFEALSSSLNQGWAPLRGVLSKDLKFVDLPLPELYDLARDPGETRNLVATRPEDLGSLRALLGRYRGEDRGTARRQEEDPAVLEKLRALGYVSGLSLAGKEHYTEDDDPKRLVAVDARNRDIIRLYMEGRFDDAIALSKQSVAERPDMPMAWTHLAYLERARGDLAAAVAAARKAFALRPTDSEAAALLATYLTEAGRAREALDLLEPVSSADPRDLDVLTAKGMSLAALGRREEALAAFGQAREVDPSNAMALVNVGTVYLQSGDRAKARQAFEGALDIDPNLARAENSLGVIALLEERPAEAIERWKRAAALNPADYQTLFNLGFTLRRQGREAEARPYFEAYLRVAPVALEKRDIARVRAWLAAGP